MSISDSFFVDSGVSYYSGMPVSICTGLWHLEGMEVAILADGHELPRQTVINGAITLSTPANKVHVGLPIVADLQTLPAALEQAAAFGQTTQTNVTKVFLRTVQSGPVKAGPSFEKLTETKFAPPTTYGAPLALKTGRIDLVIEPTWTDDAQVCIRQDKPLPVTVCSVALEVA